MSDKEFVRYPDLKRRFGIPYSFEHCSRLAQTGKFPPKVRLSYKCVGWLARDIERWIEDHRESGGVP